MIKSAPNASRFRKRIGGHSPPVMISAFIRFRILPLVIVCQSLDQLPFIGRSRRAVDVDSAANFGISFLCRFSFFLLKQAGLSMTIPFFHIPREIRTIAERIEAAGNKAYIVGGALRDFYMKRHEANDFDMATDALPQE
ncbi:MAG TPA: hypothetical protein VN437_01245, partial [Rectinemataceae bacterium]|nr:hypothetical protein [Rectinemataceae bacterium]